MDIEKNLNDLEVTATSEFQDLNYLEKERDEIELRIKTRIEELICSATDIKIKCADAMSAIHETSMLPDEMEKELNYIDDLDYRANKLIDKCDGYIK